MKLTNTRQIQSQRGVKLLVHGPAGAGKTRLCATTGDLEHTLIISCEGGLLSLREYDLRVADVASLADLREVHTHLAQGGHGFTWVCLDSISEIAEVVLSAEKKASKDPRAAYGAMQDSMIAVIRAFRDLPLNVYFSAKQKAPDDADPSYRLSMPGKTLTSELPYLFDEVLALRVERDESGGVVRSLQTYHDGRFYAKDRSGALAPYEQANLAAIVAKIGG